MPLIRSRLHQVIALAAAVSSICAFAADDTGISPYRPSVSSPAQLPLPGQLELELGILSSKMGESRRDSLPYQFKLAFNPQWGVLIGGDSYVSARDEAGNRVRGVGDTTLILKHAFLIDDRTALGLELGAKLPTAKDGIGSGKADYSLNWIFSRDMNRVHLDTNLNLTRLGTFEPETSGTQAGWSASFSLPVADKWGTTAELSGTHRMGAPNTAQLLAAVTYSPNNRLTIDCGIAKGLNKASQDWSLFSGIVLPIANF